MLAFSSTLKTILSYRNNCILVLKELTLGINIRLSKVTIYIYIYRERERERERQYTAIHRPRIPSKVSKTIFEIKSYEQDIQNILSRPLR